MNFFEFAWNRRDDVLSLGLEHILLVLVSVGLATVIGVLLGVFSYRNPRARGLVLGIAGAMLTIPSFSLFVLMIPLVGLGAVPVIIALTMYGLLPVIRNTITGLREVDPAIVESAQGMGLNQRQRLIRIELPMAWPIILTGIRVTTVILVGIAAIGNIVNGPGYGQFIFTGLSRVGTPVAVNLTVLGIVGVIVIAILFDAAFTLLGRLTTSKGIR